MTGFDKIMNMASEPLQDPQGDAKTRQAQAEKFARDLDEFNTAVQTAIRMAHDNNFCYADDENFTKFIHGNAIFFLGMADKLRKMMPPKPEQPGRGSQYPGY